MHDLLKVVAGTNYRMMFTASCNQNGIPLRCEELVVYEPLPHTCSKSSGSSSNPNCLSISVDIEEKCSAPSISFDEGNQQSCPGCFSSNDNPNVYDEEVLEYARSQLEKKFASTIKGNARRCNFKIFDVQRHETQVRNCKEIFLTQLH